MATLQQLTPTEVRHIIALRTADVIAAVNQVAQYTTANDLNTALTNLATAVDNLRACCKWVP